MRTLPCLDLFLLAPLAFASHFTGTYADPQSGLTLTIQHGGDGRMQGSMSGPLGQFTLEGQGNEQGAWGALNSQQGNLGFQAQLSPDGQSLQLALYEMGANGQAVPKGQSLVLRRSSGTPTPAAPNAMPTPPMPNPTPMPGAASGLTPPPGAVPVQAPLSAAPQPPALPSGGWQGSYATTDGGLVMTVQGQQGNYSGYFDISGQRYPFQAQGNDTVMEGLFQANGAAYPFHAELSGSRIRLLTGDGAEYVLEPAGAPTGNPLRQ